MIAAVVVVTDGHSNSKKIVYIELYSCCSVFFVIATSQAYLAAGLSHLPLGVLLGMPPFAGARNEQFI